MTFSISFMDTPPEYPYDDPFAKAARGAIVLGGFREEFLASLGEWTEEGYRQQWKRSIRSLLDGERKAVLITTFSSPTSASHLEWWALYREGEKVLVQNQLVFFKDIQGVFDVNRAVDALREHQSHGEEGTRISEWVVSINELRDFAEQTGDRNTGDRDVAGSL